jgi:hypothetical protein
MKFRSFIRPLALVAGLLLVLGLGLLGRLTLNTPLYLIERGGQAQPLALQFVPKQSTVVASVLVRPDRLASLWDYLAAPRLRQATRRDQELIEQALLANTGLSYSRDLQPWLGEEVTAAMVTPDLDYDPTNGTTPATWWPWPVMTVRLPRRPWSCTGKTARSQATPSPLKTFRATG